MLQKNSNAKAPTDGFDGPQYWEKHVFVLPVQETFLAQILYEFNSHRQFNLHSLPRESLGLHDRDPDVESLVHELLSHASTMKLSHGLKNNKLGHLSKLWYLPENADADIEPGTFAAYLRWGSIHLEQTPSLQPLLVACSSEVLKAGVLEAVE